MEIGLIGSNAAKLFASAGNEEEVGFAPEDTGPLKEGRKQQPGSPIYDVRMKSGQARNELRRMS